MSGRAGVISVVRNACRVTTSTEEVNDQLTNTCGFVYKMQTCYVVYAESLIQVSSVEVVKVSLCLQPAMTPTPEAIIKAAV